VDSAPYLCPHCRKSTVRQAWIAGVGLTIERRAGELHTVTSQGVPDWAYPYAESGFTAATSYHCDTCREIVATVLEA